jgi:hypothetical protein
VGHARTGGEGGEMFWVEIIRSGHSGGGEGGGGGI